MDIFPLKISGSGYDIMSKKVDMTQCCKKYCSIRREKAEVLEKG